MNRRLFMNVPGMVNFSLICARCMLMVEVSLNCLITSNAWEIETFNEWVEIYTVFNMACNNYGNYEVLRILFLTC